MNYLSTKIQVDSQLCRNKKYTAQSFKRNDTIWALCIWATEGTNPLYVWGESDL